jgi:hypothetical protein
MPSQETTPLLSDRPDLPLHAGPTRVHDAVPISSRACHSAWPWLGQRALVFVRGGILAYLTALLPLLVRNKVVGNTAGGQTPWGVMFDFSTIAHVLQWVWHLVSFVGPVSGLLEGASLELMSGLALALEPHAPPSVR